MKLKNLRMRLKRIVSVETVPRNVKGEIRGDVRELTALRDEKGRTQRGVTGLGEMKDPKELSLRGDMKGDREAVEPDPNVVAGAALVTAHPSVND